MEEKEITKRDRRPPMTSPRNRNRVGIGIEESEREKWEKKERSNYREKRCEKKIDEKNSLETCEILNKI